MRELNKEAVSKVLAQTFDDTTARIHEVHGRYWKSRLDACKTVLTLTSAILAGTVTFSERLLDGRSGSPAPAWILEGAWAFFAFSILAALYALWHLYSLESVGPAFFNARSKVDAEVDAVPPMESDEALSARLDQIVKSAVADALRSATASDRTSHLAVGAQYFLFGIGMVAFVIFGILLVA